MCASLYLALYLGLGIRAPLSRASMGMDLYCGALPAPSAAQWFQGGQHLSSVKLCLSIRQGTQAAAGRTECCSSVVYGNFSVA